MWWKSSGRHRRRIDLVLGYLHEVFKQSSDERASWSDLANVILPSFLTSCHTIRRNPRENDRHRRYASANHSPSMTRCPYFPRKCNEFEIKFVQSVRDGLRRILNDLRRLSPQAELSKLCIMLCGCRPPLSSVLCARLCPVGVVGDDVDNLAPW